MARLSRKLRVGKWMLTVGCALILGAFGASWFVVIEYSWPSMQGPRVVGIEGGIVGLAIVPSWHTPFIPGWRCEPYSAGDLPSSYSVFVPTTATGYGTWALLVPLWWVLVPALVPTLWLWRRDLRTRPRPGCCPECHYDLTGNESGICPECGSKVAASPAIPAPVPSARPPE
jgi:hypothetical protein